MGSRGQKSGASKGSSPANAPTQGIMINDLLEADNLVWDLASASDLSNSDLQGIVESAYDDLDEQDRVLDKIREMQEFTKQLTYGQREWLGEFARSNDNSQIKATILPDGELYVEAINRDAGKVRITVAKYGGSMAITSDKYGTSIF